MIAVAALILAAVPGLAFGAEAVPHVEGRHLGHLWAVPFVGIVLSIAFCPLFTPQFWHHHFGKVSTFWAITFVVPFTIQEGPALASYAVLHTTILEYIPFIILLLALFTVTGGIRLTGNLHGSPALNTGMLALGTVLASCMGTTGAAMLLVGPLIRANDTRPHNAHVFIFLIFLVANIGGSLTPLGDPPLFLGFLKGVDFFWTTTHLLAPMLLVSAILLIVFYILDSYFFRKEGTRAHDPTPDMPWAIHGRGNIILLAGVLAAVLMSGMWKPGLMVTLYHNEIELQNLVRDVVLLAIAYVSFRHTDAETRRLNEFSLGPIAEVAKLFAGIFLTIIPVIAMLRAGRDGALAPLVQLVTGPDGRQNDAMYFWLTGGLSSFLDNAPTYLVFFNTAGGDAATLMGPLASTLAAISAGAVFMGANSYIGNAPNFMVLSMTTARGIKMPSFVGYMAWSGAILIPCFLLVTWVFFR